MGPTDPEGSCAAYADAYAAMTDEEKACKQAMVCCEATNGTDTAMCTMKDSAGCAPAPELPDYQCADNCHIHSECEAHDDHDHVHYHGHDCTQEPADPSGSCAEYADAYAAMTDEEKACKQAMVCCEATNGTDTAACTLKDGDGCSGSAVKMV